MRKYSDDEILAFWGEAWAERAGILEFEAGLTRKEAEKQADILHPHPFGVASGSTPDKPF